MKTRFLIMLLLIGLPALSTAQDRRDRRDRSERRSERGAEDDLTSDSFTAFRLVLNRNIFDSSRMRDRTPQRVDAVSTQPIVTTEHILLNGAMIYETQGRTEMLAFFSGSRPEYNATLKASDTLVGYRIAEVRTNGVDLKGTSEPITMTVGSALQREAEGPWRLGPGDAFLTRVAAAPSRSPEPRREQRSERGDSRSGRDFSRSGRGDTRSGRGDSQSGSRMNEPTPATSSASPSPASSGGESAEELRKKMMERRRQEEGR